MGVGVGTDDYATFSNVQLKIERYRLSGRAGLAPPRLYAGIRFAGFRNSIRRNLFQLDEIVAAYDKLKLVGHHMERPSKSSREPTSLISAVAREVICLTRPRGGLPLCLKGRRAARHASSNTWLGD